MDFFEVVNKRYSCRNYRSDTVEIEKLNKCVEAAVKSPTACNNQPWKFILVTDPAIVARLKPLLSGALNVNTFTKDCPAFAVLVNEGESIESKIGCIATKKHFSEIDCGMAAQTFCLAAAAQDVATCVMGLGNEKRIKKLLDVPPRKRVLLVIACGYEMEKTKRRGPRKHIKEVRAYDNYKQTERKIISSETPEL